MNLLQQVSDRVKSETYLTPDAQAEVLARFASSLYHAAKWETANLILDQHQQPRAARAAAHQAKAAAEAK